MKTTITKFFKKITEGLTVKHVLFIMAGAAAVQVGTANFLDPRACVRITQEIAAWMDAHGVHSLEEIRGCARG